MNEQPRSELIERLAAGELAPDDPEVVAAATNDPGLRAHVAELERIQALLTRAGQAEAAALAGAEGLADAPVVDVRAALGSRLRPPSRPAFDWRWLMAAALLIAIGSTWLLWSGNGRSPETIRLGGEIRIQDAERLADRRLRLRWETGAPGVVRFSASLHRQESSAELAAAPQLLDPQWTFAEAAADALPVRVVLRVQAYDAAGDPVGYGEAMLTLPR